jgi:hypothetical protein
LAAALLALACATKSEEAEAERAGPPATEPVDVDPVFAGVVLENIRTGSYAYMNVRTAGGAERWVVTLGGGEPTGSQVEVRAFGVRHGFRSKRLDRTFDHLVFGIVHQGS